MAGFENDKIFLLSEDEYLNYCEKIRRINGWWWLRTPCVLKEWAGTVCGGGMPDNVIYSEVYSYTGLVRPAIKFTDSDKRIDNKVYKCGYTWIVIDDEEKIAIAEFAISARSFDECDNDYSMSAIRDYLLKWYEDREEI